MLKRIKIKLEFLIKNIVDIINTFGELLYIFCEFQEILINKNVFQIISLCATQTLKIFQKINFIIHAKSWYLKITNVCFDLNGGLILNFGLFQKPYFVRKTRQWSVIWIRDMYETSNPCVVRKIIRFFIKSKYLPQLELEKK